MTYSQKIVGTYLIRWDFSAPLHFGRNDITMYVNYYHLGYVALGKYSKLHIFNFAMSV